MDVTFWDDRYAAEDYAYGLEPNDFVAEVTMHVPEGQVLCLAEGEGRNAVHLAKLGHRVTAVDQSAMGLAKARRLAEANGVVIETVHADLKSYEIMPSAWAGIVATFAHLPPPLRRKVHAAVVQGLMPGGVFILEAYTPAQLALGTGGPKVPELLMSLDGLRNELSGLEFIVAQEIERDMIEGNFHHGRGAVVQILARRRWPAPHSNECAYVAPVG